MSSPTMIWAALAVSDHELVAQDPLVPVTLAGKAGRPVAGVVGGRVIVTGESTKGIWGACP